MATEQDGQLDNDYNDLIWQIIEAKILYYQPDVEWVGGFVDSRMPTDAEYDNLEQSYLTICREMGEENTLVHKQYPGFEDITGEGMMEIDLEDPDVREVYQVLTEDFREYKRKHLKKPKKNKPKAKRSLRDMWDVWEGYIYPEEAGIWRKQVFFLATDYSHAMTILQVLFGNSNLCQVFTPALESKEISSYKRYLKKEPFLIEKVERYEVKDEETLGKD